MRFRTSSSAETLTQNLQQSADLKSRIQMYEDLLLNLHPQLDPQLAIQVENALDGLPVTSPLSLSPSPVEGLQNATNNPVQPTDHTVEDYNRDRDTQATGFVGRPSEVAWLHDLRTEPGMRSRGSLRQSGCSSPLSANYFLDDLEILVAGQTDELYWPSKEAATQLVESYFQNLHASFPFIGKIIFWEQFRWFYANSDARPGAKWIALLNLVFAVASRHNCLVQKQFGAGSSYFTRAWKLYTSDFATLGHPSLQQVQIESLISLYLLLVGQINRAWRMCGIALRSAVAMGIHLRTENQDVSSISKETRYRLWWALYSLDVQLCLMTGRPLNMNLYYCTTPLPVPYPEESFLDDSIARVIADENARKAIVASFAPRAISQDGEDHQIPPPFFHSIRRKMREDEQDATAAPEFIEPNSSIYFICRVDLACIGRNAIEEIHSPKTASLTWDGLETSIARINAATDDWLARLPLYYRFDKSSPSFPFVRQRTSLAFRFYSMKLVILEPCLRRVIGVPTEGPCSALCQTMAALCMQVARNILDLIPDEPDIPWLYEYCPWWSILHYIMQSSTILVVGFAGGVELGSLELDETLRYIKKACRWLQEMSKTDEFSRRACNVFHEVAACHIPDLVCLLTTPA
ncbi:uncharacterized protein N7496_006024 [Penicillium cataractarum]|uniref:Xylanolytic transcriptional activator regulatory domain-containing protein n=1 Tax=Penicillium cataractarum TaxID=2100454 RepID=A0A9W9S1F5_9EURO|nr:uncharacterized protein N7496_006024 [Penicillium cataractarum]KAJ5369932.1 hypothetical protein N7496_006024 [Penicillium cataractarum]